MLEILNRKARADYAILETVECGIELQGCEVKSLRQGQGTINDSFARLQEGELVLFNSHISPYAQASYLNTDPVRPRKLLLHKRQIERLTTQLSQRGLTLVPLKMYFNSRGFVKVELGLCKGKKQYDKRADIKRRESDMHLRRVVKNRR
jgi:SsrA-binding protein